MHPCVARILSFVFPITCTSCGADLPYDDRLRVCPDCQGKVRAITGLVCVQCGTPLESGGARCYDCKTGKKHHFYANRSAVRYEGVARELIVAFKYRFRDYLQGYLGAMLLACVRAQYRVEEIDIVVPVPMHWTKRLFRGYNQAALLAEHVARGIRRPLAVDALQRRRMTLAQAGLRREERLRNLDTAVIARSDVRVKGKHILLVDDVATTCATLDACARALLNAGAAKVSCATVARD